MSAEQVVSQLVKISEVGGRCFENFLPGVVLHGELLKTLEAFLLRVELLDHVVHVRVLFEVLGQH